MVHYLSYYIPKFDPFVKAGLGCCILCVDLCGRYVRIQVNISVDWNIQSSYFLVCLLILLFRNHRLYIGYTKQNKLKKNCNTKANIITLLELCAAL